MDHIPSWIQRGSCCRKRKLKHIVNIDCSARALGLMTGSPLHLMSRLDGQQSKLCLANRARCAPLSGLKKAGIAVLGLPR